MHVICMQSTDKKPCQYLYAYLVMDAGVIVFLAEGESEESQESMFCLFSGL